MAHAASHQIFLLALRQVDRVLERRLGLAKARNIIPLTLHGKQGDIGYRCEIDMAAAVPHLALRQQVPLENRVDRLEIELRRHIAHGAILLVKRLGCVGARSEEHTSELQSLMRISYAVFCWKTKKHH